MMSSPRTRWAALAHGEPYEDILEQWRVPAPNVAELRWLRGQGISRAAILCPSPIGATNVTFQGNIFELDPNGERVLTFLVENCGSTIDIAAWQPRTRKLATWLNAGFAIGQDAISNPASYFDGDALPVHETPLQWLRAKRQGVVILRPELANVYLRNAPRLSFASAVQAQRVKRWCRPPKFSPQFLVEISGELPA